MTSSNERIAAKGAEAVTVPVRWTIWGPVVWKDAKGVEYAQHWVAHDPDVLSSDVTRLDRARSLDDLLTGSAGIGIPNQNITIADASGRIGWTIAGAIPRRVGGDGVLPQSWADGTRRWDGYLAPPNFPASSIPQPAGSGPPTRRSSMARCWRRSAKAVMPTAFARGSFAIG